MDYSAAGWMLSILQFVSLPFSFIIPVLAGRNPNQRMLVTISALSMLTGYAGLFSGLTSLNLLWVMLVGISGGANFSLSLMFFTLRTKSAQEAAALSGMAQSLGYLLAAVGPLLIGFLHDATGDGRCLWRYYPPLSLYCSFWFWRCETRVSLRAEQKEAGGLTLYQSHYSDAYIQYEHKSDPWT